MNLAWTPWWRNCEQGWTMWPGRCGGQNMQLLPLILSGDFSLHWLETLGWTLAEPSLSTMMQRYDCSCWSCWLHFWLVDTGSGWGQGEGNSFWQFRGSCMKLRTWVLLQSTAGNTRLFSRRNGGGYLSCNVFHPQLSSHECWQVSANICLTSSHSGGELYLLGHDGDITLQHRFCYHHHHCSLCQDCHHH